MNGRDLKEKPTRRLLVVRPLDKQVFILIGIKCYKGKIRLDKRMTIREVLK